MENPAREKRWLVVVQNGDHVTLGRHTDPADAEIADISRKLDEMAAAGWLVVSEGGYYGSGHVTLLNVRRLTQIEGDWQQAEDNWHAKRRQANTSTFPH